MPGNILRFRFYDGTGPWAEWTDKLVLLRSRPYTHVELQFSDGLSFSSSIRKTGPGGKRDGVRFKNINYAEHLERWCTVAVPVTAEQERSIRCRAELLVALGIKYDYRFILGFVITGQQAPWKFGCSEAVYAVIAPDLAVGELNFKMSPQRLFSVVTELARIRKTIPKGTQ